MSADDAKAIVERQRMKLALDDQMQFCSAEKAIVEYKKDRQRPGPTEDRLAWILTYRGELGSTRVDVDDVTGEVLWIISDA